ncbi:MAG: transcriptional repressor [Desulfobulbaceae bacterium]
MSEADQAFRAFLQERNLHYTHQRALILDVFLEVGTHVSVEELYGHVLERDPAIGQVTVFRTLKLLEEAGIAAPVNLGDKTVRYEPAYRAEHHDHLICTRCGRVIEVLDVKLEKRQEKLCRKYGFTPTHHRLDIFGICPDCR